MPSASGLIGECLRHGIVDEAFVIDGGSTDGTAQRFRSRGVDVVLSADLAPGAPVLGKGDSLCRAADLAKGETLVFIDADVRGLVPADVDRLAGAVEIPGQVLAKGAFDRLPGDGGPPRRLNGRITTLTAKPMLDLLMPGLAHITQPLSGQQSIRRDVLQQLDLLTGYAFEVSLLIQVAARYGAGAVVDVPISPLTHRTNDDAALVPAAREVVAAILWSLDVVGADGARVPLPPSVVARRPSARR